MPQKKIPFEKQEKIVSFILPYFFALCFITTAVGAYAGYIVNHPFNMGDWLINYSGGFVRRGFLGTVIIQISNLNFLNPGINTIILQILAYGIFFWYSLKLLRKQSNILPYIFLIFSPFIFTFQINDFGGGFRKEILYFALLACLILKSNELEKKNFEKLFFITILFIYPLLILSHEVFAVFLPYFLIIFTSKYKIDKKNLFTLFLLTIPSLLTFLLLILNYSNNNIDTSAIFLEISNHNYTIKQGAISWLGTNSNENIRFVKETFINNNYFFIYSYALFLSLLAFLPISQKLKNVFSNKVSIALALISIFGSIPLFIIAADWGRFIYMHLVSWFLLSLLDIKETKCNNFFYNISISVSVILYFTLWHIPHCCSSNIFINRNNNIVLNWLVPYLYISNHFSNNS